MPARLPAAAAAELKTYAGTSPTFVDGAGGRVSECDSGSALRYASFQMPYSTAGTSTTHARFFRFGSTAIQPAAPTSIVIPLLDDAIEATSAAHAQRSLPRVSRDRSHHAASPVANENRKPIW